MDTCTRLLWLVESDVKRFVFDLFLNPFRSLCSECGGLVPGYAEEGDEATDPVFSLHRVHAQFDEHSGGTQAS